MVIEGERVGTIKMTYFCDDNNLEHVPIITTGYKLPNTMEEMKLEADGFSTINKKVKREDLFIELKMERRASKMYQENTY